MSMKVKFILTYVAGIVTGIVLIFAVGLFMAKSVATSASNKDVVMFEKPRGVVPGKVFEVIKYETLPLCSVCNPREEIVDSQ